MVGRLLSYWVSVTFHGRTVKLGGGIFGSCHFGRGCHKKDSQEEECNIELSCSCRQGMTCPWTNPPKIWSKCLVVTDRVTLDPHCATLWDFRRNRIPQVGARSQFRGGRWRFFGRGSELVVMVGVANVFFCTALSQTKNHRGFGKATRTNVMMIFSQAKMLASIDSVKMFRPIVLSLSLFLLKALNETAVCFFMILLMEEVWRFGAHELI